MLARAFLVSMRHFPCFVLRAFALRVSSACRYMEGRSLTITFQNPDSNSAHDRSASGGSMTAVVGLALDDGDTGAPDFRLVQTFTDEYASHLS